MGCSPSKGRPLALLPGTQEDSGDSRCPEEGGTGGPVCNGETDPGGGERVLAAQEETCLPPQDRGVSLAETAPGVAVVSYKEDAEAEMVFEQREGNPTVEERQGGNPIRKSRKMKGTRQREREKTFSPAEPKVASPEALSKAQVAYACMDPSVSKYEALVDVLDQATQALLSLQPMAALVALRYEEVNRELEGMAEEGERMLKAHESRPERPTPAEVELMLQMLKYTREKTKVVGDFVGGLGDSALEDAVDFFAALSELLDERLGTKRAAQSRLAQVLARVKAAALSQKPGPEDSTLHSEDSGFGAESESLAGSERHQHRCGSSARPKRAESFGNHAPQWIEEDMTASWTGRRASALVSQLRRRSVELPSNLAEAPTLLELERTQRDLSQRLERMRKWQAVDEEVPGGLFQDQLRQPNGNVTRSPVPRMRRHSSGEQHTSREEDKAEEEEKKNDPRESRNAGLVTDPPTVTAPQPAVLCRGKNSVKRLINTFSCGPEAKKTQDLHLRGVRKCGVLRMVNGELVLDSNDNNDICGLVPRATHRLEDLDVESLPPPPPEVLMDNSFERVQDSQGGDGLASKGRTSLSQRSGVSQQLRSSLQTIEVLPSRGTLCRGSLNVQPAGPVRQDAVGGPRGGNDTDQRELESGRDEAASLYRQARKIIHLRHSAESPVKDPLADSQSRKPSPVRAGTGPRWEGHGSLESQTPEANSQPPSTPPASRSCVLPILPLEQKGLTRQVMTPSSAPTSYRAPTPPTSPRNRRWARESGGQEPECLHSSPSPSFNNARSIFCQRLPLPQGAPASQAWTPSSSCTLPRPWGEASRGGRLPFLKHGQTDQRTGRVVPPQTSPAPVPAEPQNQGSESATSTQGMEDGPIGEKPCSNQPSLSTASQSAADREQCIVAMQSERLGLHGGPATIMD